MRAERLPLLLLFGASCMWGLAWMPMKALAARGFSGVALVLVACGTAGLILLPRLVTERKTWRGQGAWLLGIALLGGYANLAFTTATIQGEVVRVMVLFYLLPAWGVLGGRLFLGESLDAPRLAAVVLALAGAWLVLGGFGAWHGSAGWTDIVAITCGMSFAANNLVFRARQTIPLASKTAMMLLGAAVMAVPLLLLDVQPLLAASTAAWLGAVGYGIVWLLCSTFATQFGVTHMEAGRASIIIILELVIAVVSAVLIGGEHMQPAEMAGGIMIMSAAVIEAWRAS